jgi:hypothetical protein
VDNDLIQRRRQVHTREQLSGVLPPEVELLHKSRLALVPVVSIDRALDVEEMWTRRMEGDHIQLAVPPSFRSFAHPDLTAEWLNYNR